MRVFSKVTIGVVATLVIFFLVACQGESASQPAQPVGETQSVSGTIRFENVETAFTNADVYVRLEDVSRADAPAITIAEQTLSNISIEAGTGRTLDYTLSHPDLEPRNSYAMRIHVDVDRSGRQITTGDYINTSRYSVPAPGSTEPIDIVVELIPDRNN